MVEQAVLGGLVVVGAHLQSGVGAGLCRQPVSSTASLVELEPADAITGTRLRVCLTTALMTSTCSSWDSVADSPVVPHGTSPSHPTSSMQ